MKKINIILWLWLLSCSLFLVWCGTSVVNTNVVDTWMMMTGDEMPNTLKVDYRTWTDATVNPSDANMNSSDTTDINDSWAQVDTNTDTASLQ